MAEGSFFTKDARARTTRVVKEIEAQTSAEVVVSVRHVSGHYRHTDYLVGAVVALVSLLLLLFLDQEFELWVIPIDVALGFAAGAFLSAQVWTLRRALTSRKLMDERVFDKACAAFVKMGISRTTRRCGILVFASTFEQTAVVLADVGVDVTLLGDEWKKAQDALTASLRGGASFDRFAIALATLGPVLGAAMPHHAGDANELPDELDAA